jgi:hypothetical protein
MMHEVFVSYSSGDEKIAYAICSYLEKNAITCWIAPRDIEPGEIFASALIRAIDATKVFVIIFSENSNRSEHVRTEIERAFNQKKIIIPFRIDRTQLSDELQYFIAGRQWLDASLPPLENHFDQLQKVIDRHLVAKKPDISVPTVSKSVPPEGPGAADIVVKSLTSFTTSLSDVFTKIAYKLSWNKKLLFGVTGFVSGAIGALLGDLFPSFDTYLGSIISMGFWAGIIGLVISVGLYWATSVYNRSQLDLKELLKKSVPPGFLAGFLSGGFAQAIYALPDIQDILISIFFQSSCWGLFGGLLGWRLSSSNRNLGALRAAIAGIIGGFIGGWGFEIISIFIPEELGRMFGIGILGMALSLSLILIEERYRPAFLEVCWAKNESSKFTLGNKPLVIGGGKEDDVYINGIPPRTMSLWMDHGKVKGTYHITGDNKELQDGNRIHLGKAEMFVRIKAK